MYTFITLLIVLISVLLILLVLIQKPKGGGLAQGFSSTNQIMGVKRTSDVVERGTWILSLSLLTLLCSLTCGFPVGKKSSRVQPLVWKKRCWRPRQLRPHQGLLAVPPPLAPRAPLPKPGIPPSKSAIARGSTPSVSAFQTEDFGILS
ncbi:MAG: preprotein translocase subunit SecG [Bacteroidota bacterium]